MPGLLMATTLRVLRDTVRAASLLWDTVWDGFVGDWAPAAPTEADNRGGLRARAPLATAVLLCWMTDARADPSDQLPDDSGDPRGWAGDAVDPTCDPIGSKFWLLRRTTLTDDTADRAILYGQAALQTLIRQGACATIDVTARANIAAQRLELTAKLYRADGTLIDSVDYDLLWQASSNVRHPLAPNS